MKKLSTNEIRSMWIAFFKTKNHHFLPPVSLIPVEDPSLLWINSGVATLKPYFDGRKTPPAPRLTNSQKAIRTNDIENVGITARHHTMFEMLGNFSIGDYFKKEAIHFAWELLTSPQWFAMDPTKLYITVFNEDDEAYDIWTNEIKIPKTHIFKMGRDTNFWDVGQGPCGPNTEIFFDRGPQWDKDNIGVRLLADDLENDRYIEIWNVVFSQFNNDGNDNYLELPRKNIDTGAGLERIASVFQDTPTNFETDLFWPTIQQIESLCAKQFKYSKANYFTPDPKQTRINTCFKIIADHIRASVFAIADGVFPGNKDRGYIIRRLIRRALIKGLELKISGAFLSTLVSCVIVAMKDFYPYLIAKQTLIEATIEAEELKFLQTLNKGYEVLSKMIANEKKVSGVHALLLFESYGYPIEQTIEIANEQNVAVDLVEFQALLANKKQQAREARKALKVWNQQNELFTKLNITSTFTGWEEMTHSRAQIVFMFNETGPIQTATNEMVYIILDKTPFYAEKGGQAGDAGVFVINGIESEVLDTQQGPNHEHIHQVQVNGTVKLNAYVDAQVDVNKRFYTMKNHSGTHLIHAALRDVLGEHVMQSGSYNDEFGLRMDFTYNQSISNEQLEAVQNLVNHKIEAAIPTEVYFCSMPEALNKYHALAFFAEKYDDIVRVVKFGDFSSELCGGTHVHNTHEVEQLLITGIESKGSGVYRVKCLTSFQAIQAYVQKEFEQALAQVEVIAQKYEASKSTKQSSELAQQITKLQQLPVTSANLLTIKNGLHSLTNTFKTYQKQLSDVQLQTKLSAYNHLQPEHKNGINQLNIATKELNMVQLKTLVDMYKNKFNTLVIVASSQIEQQHLVVVGVTNDLHHSHRAIDIFNELNPKPKGGGNASLAQGKY